MALVKKPDAIKLAILGMVPGNGHPYSWSAIINGDYDKKAMSDCGYAVISEYLGAAPPGELGIEGADVTHVCCDDPADAEHVARAALIPNIVENPEDVIGRVDAVVIAMDRGAEHVDRARPFIEAGLPLFIDKPLADNEADLQQFIKWQSEGKAILSTSAMRYARECAKCRQRIGEVGELRVITATTVKKWENYGIHALEAMYPFLAPGGWVSVTNSAADDCNIVHIRHESGVSAVVLLVSDMAGAFGNVSLFGTAGEMHTKINDTLYAFKTQLVQFVKYLRTGKLPVAFAETVELMKIVIAGVRSRDEAGRTVMLSEIKA